MAYDLLLLQMVIKQKVPMGLYDYRMEITNWYA